MIDKATLKTPSSLDTPVVSVLMPLYNAESYVHDAVESILSQTFENFELIIVNDCSTDKSIDIVSSFPDARIRLIHNESRIGVTRSLNHGLQHVSGMYIARMDADDVALPERLARQVRFLELYPEVGMVATGIQLIDATGNPTGVWSAETKACNAKQIRKILPKENCLAHPSVMVRWDILQKYRYDEDHAVAQDYDLWLRLSASGVMIGKITDTLLLNRVHRLSVTSMHNNSSCAQGKNLRTKWSFLVKRMAARGVNFFVMRVALWFLKDLLVLLLLKVTSSVSKLLFAIGETIGSILPLRPSPSLFFFFPFFHIGGAEKVHADIVACFKDERPIQFFTNCSSNRRFLQKFSSCGPCYNAWIPMRVVSPFMKGILSAYINRHPSVTVFGANSRFFYSLIPSLASHVRLVDLVHAFGTWVEKYSIDVAERLTYRVVIAPEFRKRFKDLYSSEWIEDSLIDRVVLITNRVDVPSSLQRGAKPSLPLKALYVGRGTEEKRVHLVGKCASICQSRNIPLQFTLVGDVEDAVLPVDRHACTFRGEMENKEVVSLYPYFDVIVITSRFEGFPVAVMEAMAHGVVPVCVAVGGIPDHLQSGYNGILIDPVESLVPESLAKALDRLCKDRELLEKLSSNAYAYAKANFTGSSFRDRYRDLMLEGL